MIKRRFYRLERGDKDYESGSSSFSSDSEVEAEESEESEDEVVAEESEDDAVAEESEDGSIEKPKEDNESGSISSGYESGDSSADDELKADSAGLLSGDEADSEEDAKIPIDPKVSHKIISLLPNTKSNTAAANEQAPTVLPSYIFQRKSVYRCRICPRVVCLNAETMMTHVKSKKHARSEKLLLNDKLKTTLNSDGEIEEHEVDEEPEVPVTTQVKPKRKRKENRKGSRQRRRAAENKDKGDEKVVEVEKHSIKKKVVEVEKHSIKKKRKTKD